MPDPVYIQARRVLLDALEALGDQRDALVLVGAQAITSTPARVTWRSLRTRAMATSRLIPPS